LTVAEFLERKARRSEATRQTYAKAEASFARCFKVDSPDVVVARIKGGRLDAYEALDKFVGTLTANGAAPKTILTYVAAVKGLLRYEEITLDSYKFRAKVELPPKTEISIDRIPTREEMRTIVLNSDRKTRALIALLATSGLRIGEAASLRVGNIDFENCKVTLLSPRTKSRRSRITFISEETAGFLKEFLGRRIGKKEDWLFLDERRFNRRAGPDALYMNVYRVLKKLGLKKRLDPDSKRNELHPHSFRKYFFSKMIGAGVDRGVAERFMGHNYGFDNAYLHMDEDRLRKEYLKAVEDFTFLTDRKPTREQEERIQTLEKQVQELRDLRQMIQAGISQLEIKRAGPGV
jgi:integrase